MIRRRVTMAVGCAALVATWLLHGTLWGSVVWAVASSIACLGHGGVVVRLVGLRVARPMVVTIGLATMVLLGLALAWLGVLVASVQVALVVAGIAATLVAAPATEVAPRPLTWVLCGFVGLLLVALALVRAETPVVDGLNHVFAVKQLWDTGALDPGPSSSGFMIVGSAVFALGGGAVDAGMFEAVCGVILVATIAEELASDDEAAGFVLGVALTIVALEPLAPTAMAATLLHVAAIAGLRTRPASGVAWHVIALAIALATVRDELMLLAWPYVASAIVAPRFAKPGRSTVALLVAASFVAYVGMQLVMASAVGLAVAKSAAVLLAIPVAAVLGRLVGSFDGSAPYAAMCWAIGSYVLGLVIYFILPWQHAGAASFAAWFAPAVAILGGAMRPDGKVHRSAAAVVLAVSVAVTLLVPLYSLRETERLAQRFTHALLGARTLAARDTAHEELRQGQLVAPPGAVIAFWGRSAGRLDFDRNVIRDVTTDRGRTLVPIRPSMLDGASYLLLEDLHVLSRVKRPWFVTYPPVLEAVAHRLSLERSIGTTRIFRVNLL